MAKGHYLPASDKDRAIWLTNFANKFSMLAAALGFLPAEVIWVNNDANMFIYLLNQIETFITAKEVRVNYKNLIRNGPLGSPGGSAPLMPVVPAAPTTVAPGIFPRIAQLVQRIKNSTTYTEAMGHDLGIIGSEEASAQVIMKPTLKLVMKGGQVEVQWIKGDADALLIESDKGSGTWQFLAVDTVPHYPDTTPITAPSVWKYRAMYMVNDERVGLWSDVASITVS